MIRRGIPEVGIEAKPIDVDMTGEVVVFAKDALAANVPAAEVFEADALAAGVFADDAVFAADVDVVPDVAAVTEDSFEGRVDDFLAIAEVDGETEAGGDG